MVMIGIADAGYGYVITGYKLIKNWQAWLLLPFVLNICKAARGIVHNMYAFCELSWRGIDISVTSYYTISGNLLLLKTEES